MTPEQVEADLGVQFRGHLSRLYPTPEQAARLRQWAGAIRFVYNLALEQRQTYDRPGRRIGWAQQCRELKDLRAEAEWLADVPATALHQAVRDLGRAHANWASRRARKPRFRHRSQRSTMHFPVQEGVRLEGRAGRYGRVRLPRIGEMKVRLSRSWRGEVRSMAVYERAGRWYLAARIATVVDAAPPNQKGVVGIDRGVTVFAALSNGEMIEGPDVGRRSGAALAKAKRNLSRKAKGSANRRKALLRVSRLQMRVADARKDFLHKVTTNLAKNHGVVVLEDLKVPNMTASAAGTVQEPGRKVRQKAGLNRAILDQGWGMFRTMLAYKLEERGGRLLVVDPRNTSRTCAACGVVDADSRDGTRFSCRSCGHEAHADTNAAINILRRGTPYLPAEVSNAR